MTSHTVLAYVRWTLGPDPERSAPTRYIACKECEEQSPVSIVQADPDQWALDHSGRTQHRRYRECVAVDLTTHPTDEEEQ
ncbi:hypothetical protein ACFU8I_00785 [Streptomyces sp. NPDC057540]|uniref:DUF7848 domain-containing protein n=1 Tax=Streptomyces sp. NPDC057540 TaxID=3346160 RepID=UPI0036811F27